MVVYPASGATPGASWAPAQERRVATCRTGFDHTPWLWTYCPVIVVTRSGSTAGSSRGSRELGAAVGERAARSASMRSTGRTGRRSSRAGCSAAGPVRRPERRRIRRERSRPLPRPGGWPRRARGCESLHGCLDGPNCPLRCVARRRRTHRPVCRENSRYQRVPGASVPRPRM